MSIRGVIIVLTCNIINYDNMHLMLHVNIISQLGYKLVSNKQKYATIYYSLLNFVNTRQQKFKKLVYNFFEKNKLDIHLYFRSFLSNTI